MAAYKVSKKIDEKWKSFGSVKPNKWGNMSLGLHCTAEFKKIIADTPDGEWLNLACFEEKPDDKK